MGREEDHFSQWLRSNLTGCRFANHLASTTLAIETFPPPLDPSDLDSAFDRYGAANRAVAVVLPSIQNEAELVDVLNSLPASERWRLRQRTPDGGDELLYVGLEWRTASGDLCNAMGFAPLMTMPVLRRAPYFAFALWPGGRGNKRRGQPPTPPVTEGQVDLLDAFQELDDNDYKDRWDKTTKYVRALIDKPRRYRDTAFVLPLSYAQHIHFT